MLFENANGIVFQTLQTTTNQHNVWQIWYPPTGTGKIKMDKYIRR